MVRFIAKQIAFTAWVYLSRKRKYKVIWQYAKDRHKKAALLCAKACLPVEKKKILCYTDKNSAFAEINSLKTNFKEVLSYVANEVVRMAVSYKKLWKLLIDRDMKKKDLCAAAGISHASMAKLGKNENVTTDVLVKICTALQCDIGDIMELTPEISK